MLTDGDGTLLVVERPSILAGWIIHYPVHYSRIDSACVIHVDALYITAGVIGASTAAYLDLYQLERACMSQRLTSAGGGTMQFISESVAIATSQQAREGFNDEHFDGMTRWITELEPEYAD